MLRDAKTGDWIFTIQAGWLKVETAFKVVVACCYEFQRDGKSCDSDMYPSAWPEDHPDIPHWAPERPKVMVKKSIEMLGWLNEEGSLMGLRPVEPESLPFEILITVSWEVEE